LGFYHELVTSIILISFVLTATFFFFFLAIASVALRYTGPLFLNLILASIGPDLTPESRSKAYIYAVLALVATITRSELDLQHLWFGRRVAVRVRSELMAVIYDKALKRKDFSGVVDKKNGNKEEKASADVGKIVNLMSNDASAVSDLSAMVIMISSSLIEVAFASTYLFRLLGWSGFVGFLALIPSLFINSYLMKRVFSIHKDLSSARDKRMGVLNELITAIKFIKFFAWGTRFNSFEISWGLLTML
jgi:ABC-type multidrug transport system fused ATPase/permease subunit